MSELVKFPGVPPAVFGHRMTVLHGSAGGGSEPILAGVQAMRTDFRLPSPGMRLRTAAATFISVV